MIETVDVLEGGATTLSITTFSIMTLLLKGLISDTQHKYFSISDTQHKRHSSQITLSISDTHHK